MPPARGGRTGGFRARQTTANTASAALVVADVIPNPFFSSLLVQPHWQFGNASFRSTSSKASLGKQCTLGNQGNRILIGQDLEQVAVVPAGLLALGGDAALGRGLAAQQIEGQSAQD